MPYELVVGLWMEDLHKTPRELGYADTDDLSLMNRAKQAVFTYRTARHSRNSTLALHLSREEMLLLERMNRIDVAARPKRRRVSGPVRKRRGKG